MSIPQPWGGPPQQNSRPDWTPRDYWVDPPKIIPPAPTFQKWVPAPEQFAFGESPRDMSRFQALQANITRAPTVPGIPKPLTTTPPQNARPDWTLRDYSANQDRFSILATPLLPPVIGVNPPQQNARPDWTLQQYNANQDRFSGFFPTSPTIFVPAAEMIAFGELPRDMTALQNVLTIRRLAQSLPPGKPPPYVPVATYPTPPRDLTPEKLVIEANKATYLAIPVVPSGEVLMAFEYDPLDMTPYQVVAKLPMIPPPRLPQIPPTPIPYIEPPGWTPNQYQAFQDQFSALATPFRPVYPPGLRPTFTVEALIRDVPRATPVYQNYILPKVPQFQFALPTPYVQPPPWSLLSYQQIQDQFSALANNIPVAPGFRVMAVTAGMYGGNYYWPGDVFDIVVASDFSDSSVNYEIGGNEYATGWMMKVPSTTPIFQTITSQIYPMFPPVDPKRRFVL
jgi:hypothetical protein